MLKLYRFQPIVVPGDDRLSKLKRGEVWMSDPKTFNDPMDMQLVIKDFTDGWSIEPIHKTNIKNALISLIGDGKAYRQHWLFDEETIEIFTQWGSDTLPSGDLEENHVITALKQSLNKFGICCLTSMLESVLMWAHYASNSQGFCIEYDVDWSNRNGDFLYFPVQYVSELPELCMTEAMFTPSQFLGRALASKHSDWSYEREIRIVYCKGKAISAPVPENYMKISGLIAGLNMPAPLQSHLKQTAKALGVHAYRMIKKHGSELRKESMP